MDRTRREFLGATAAAGAAWLLEGTLHGSDRASVSATQENAPATPPTQPASQAAEFTFVHLTDMHVTPKRRGDLGYRACIDDVRRLRPAPAFALMGGDLAFDGNYTAKADFEQQIRLYKEISDTLGIPYYNCMGNHDALGWSARRKCAPDDPDIGKKLIMDRLGWKKSYYSFDHAGWHFAVLDSILPTSADHGPSYEPRIGPEQLEWLAHDLGAAGDRPKVCVSHHAAFCAIGQYEGDAKRKALDGSMVLQDTRELRLVLERHGVKALLQGHSHKIEEYRYRGVWYLTSAAVSGAWWSGRWNGCGPGYTLLRCRGDELTWEQRSFAWEPRLEPDDELERTKTAELEAFEREQRALRERERSRRA